MLRYSFLFFLVIPFISFSQNTINQEKEPPPFFENLWGPTGDLHKSIPKIELLNSTGNTNFVNPRGINKAVYSPDDKVIIACSREYVAGWEAETGIRKWHYKFAENSRNGATTGAIKIFKKQPWVLLGNSNGSSIILNYETGELVKQFKQLYQRVTGVDVSPKEDLIFICGAKGDYFLWDLNTEEEITLKNLPQPRTVYSVKFSNTGKYLALCGSFRGQNAFIMYNLETDLYELFSKIKHRAGQTATFTKDDQMVALGYFDGGLDLRTTIGGELIWSLKLSKPGYITKIEFTNNDKSLVALAPRSILKVNAATGNYKVLEYPVNDQKHYDDFALNSDQSKIILITRNGHRLRQYSYPRITPIPQNIGLADGISKHMLFSPDGKYFVTGGDGTGKIAFWNTDNQKIEKTLEDTHLADAQVIRFTPDGKQLAILWKPKYTPKNPIPELTMTAYSWPDLKVLATNKKIDPNTMEFCFLDKNRIALFESKFFGNYLSFPELTVKHSLHFQEDYLNEMGKELLVNLWGYRYSNISHWLNKYITERIRTILPSDPSNGTTLPNRYLFGGFSKDGKYYAAMDNQQILNAYYRSTGERLAGIPIKGYYPHKLAFSPTKNLIVVAGNDTLLRWYRVPALKD